MIKCIKEQCEFPSRFREMCQKHYLEYIESIKQKARLAIEDIIETSDEDLIALAAQPIKDIYNNVTFDEIKRFLLTKHLTSGSIKVHPKILYMLYKSWTPEPLTYSRFHKRLKKYLVSDLKAPAGCFYLTIDPFMDLIQKGVLTLNSNNKLIYATDGKNKKEEI